MNALSNQNLNVTSS